MSAEARLTELLMQWEALRLQGQPAVAEELCRDTPELLDELQRRIRALEAMNPVLAAMSSFPDGSTVTGATETDERSQWPGLPGYAVLSKLGEGGMGVVYKVRNLAFDRIEALKMIRARVARHSDSQARFQMEIKAMARFEHARIARIYAAGQHEGVPYFTMEYVESGSLTQHMRRFSANPASAVALAAKVAQAVHYLHSKNIIHRDLKPANILLKKENDEPLVSDFGLAKLFDWDTLLTDSDRADSKPELTHAGSVLGTAAYMSPEQARGETEQVNVASDVWALGVILYELLTGQKPFQGESVHAIREAVCTAEPAPPRQHVPGLAADLEFICLKCLHKDPTARYPSAAALTDDLNRWQRGEPILPEPWLRRVQRKVRGHTTEITAGLCAATFVIVAAAGVYWATRPVDREAVAEQRLQAVAAELAKGKRVTLIPERGPPSAYRWVTRGVHDTISNDLDTPFSIQGDRYALLELVPRHTLKGYRLRMEVHHDGGQREGTVGVYFGYSKQRSAQELPVHCFCGVRFNDLYTIPGRPPAQGNDVHLKLHLLYPKVPDQIPDVVRFQGVGVSTSFQPAGLPQPEPWRKLQIDVDADGIRVKWDEKPLTPLPRAKLAFYAQTLVQESPQQPQEIPQFLPQEALGIFVFRASAWFRSCTIEALPGKQPNQEKNPWPR